MLSALQSFTTSWLLTTSSNEQQSPSRAGLMYDFVIVNIGHPACTQQQSLNSYADELRAGMPLSAIDGMPIGIKDIIETIDMPTQNGSPLFDGFRSERDSAAYSEHHGSIRHGNCGARFDGRWPPDRDPLQRSLRRRDQARIG